MYTTVVTYLTTIAQPFPIFRRLLAIIPSMKNHPQLIVLNQKVNTDTKSPTKSTSAVIPNQLYHLRNNSNPEPQNPVKTHMLL